MIEGFFRERLEVAFPQLKWTENNYVEQDHTGSIYKEAGGSPDIYETGLQFPYYMIFIRSSDFDLAQRAAEGSVEIFHRMKQEDYTNYNGDTYEIIFIEATADATRIGRNESLMEWSSNFKVTLRRKK
ncbi:tail terminator [Bacillus phage 035JT001]|nr:tail terminator [Bacillus phage 035JT001]